MKKEKPVQFMARLCDCGTTNFRGSFATTKESSAIDVATAVVVQMTHAFTDAIGEQGLTAQLQYDIACALLAQLNFDSKKLRTDIKSAANLADKWRLVPKENVNEQAH